MSLTADISFLLRSLYRWEQERERTKGPPGQFNSKEAARLLGWTPERLNRAVNVLERRGLIDVDESLGSHPFATHGFELAEEGWLECERLGFDEPDPTGEPNAASGAATTGLPVERQQVLNLCATYQLAEAEPTPIGHVLLSGDPHEEVALRATVVALAKDGYVEVSGFPGQEHVHVTAGGLLASSSRDACDALAKKLLAHLVRRLGAEGIKFKSYSWAELKSAQVVAGDEDFPATLTLVELFKLSRGGNHSKGPPPRAEWKVPPSLVQLRAVTDLTELVLATAFKHVPHAAPPPQSGDANRSDAGRSPEKPLRTDGEEEEPTDFVILTAIEVESLAVRTAIGLGDGDRVRKGSRVYWRGRLPLNDGRQYTVVVAQSADMANVDMAILTNDALHHWSPQAALLVGIAATTHSSVKLGDVVIGADIYYYERGKQTPDGSKPEPKIISPDATLWSNVTALPVWSGSVPIDRPGDERTTPAVHRGVIASGEKVIADVAVRDRIADAHRKIVAIEMEGYGFSRAVWQSFEHVRHLVIRGVCDDGSPSKDDAWHKYAAASAAAFTRHFLCDGPLAPRRVGGTAQTRSSATHAPEPRKAQLTKDDLRVLAVFAEFRIGANEYLPDGSFQSRSDRFPPPLRDRAFDVLESLRDRGFLRRSEHGYILTEDGARVLYEDRDT